MAKDKEEMTDSVLAEHKIKGALTYKGGDKIQARFEMEDMGQVSNRGIAFPADVIPESFDHSIHHVVGQYQVKFVVADHEPMEPSKEITICAQCGKKIKNHNGVWITI